MNWNAIAKRTPGFVGADLVSLVKEAGMVAIARCNGLDHYGNIVPLKYFPPTPVNQSEELKVPEADKAIATTRIDSVQESLPLNSLAAPLSSPAAAVSAFEAFVELQDPVRIVLVASYH